MTLLNAEYINPIKDRVLVVDMEFGEQTTKGGIIIADDDGKSTGIHARWARVFKVGPEQKELKPGQYVLIDHGRWTRAVEVLVDDKKNKLFMIDYPKGVLIISETKPKQLEMVGL
jgi:co-chaperonin GroES (HSP10)